MNGRAYYNDSDPFVCAWLRELIRENLIAPGDVDERSIVDVSPDDVRGYTQCHWFAGIGGWSYAFRLAGWPDDRPVWTGSCPCQPFSAAGKGQAADDERHLWPAWFSLIRERRPPIVWGEQVEAAIGWGWLDVVLADLEAEGYACWPAVLPACSVGAPHIRQRLWFVADANGRREHRRSGEEGRAASSHESQVEGAHGQRLWSLDSGSGATRPVAHADGRDASPEGLQRGGQHGQRPEDGRAGGVGNAEHGGREGRQPAWRGSGSTLPPSPWSDLIWLPCTDGKARPTQPGIFPLAHGIPNRVGTLRGAGNAIVPQTAAAFIRSFLDAR